MSRLVRVPAALLLVASGAVLTAAPAWAGGHHGGDKVTLCHRTDANNNPYVQITVDPDAVFRQGHDGHNGPVWNSSLKSQGVKWGDIIPPFDYDNNGQHHYAGKNWTGDGQAIWDNGCQANQPAPGPSSSTSSPSPTPSQSSPPTGSPSQSPSGSPSQTPSTPPTSTSSASPSQSTSVSPSQSTSVLPTSSTSSSAPPPSTGSPSPSTTVLPTKSIKPPPTSGPPSGPPNGPLPFTGFPTSLAVTLGLGLISAGLLALRRRV